MKKNYVMFCIFILCSTTWAQDRDTQNTLSKLAWNDEMLNILLDTRLDFQTKMSDDDVDEMSFRGQTIKIWLAGEIIPGIRYRVRHRLNKPQSPLREGYSAATDNAWLAFDLGKSWTFTVGKQIVQFGTFEFDYNPADVYMTTTPCDNLDAYKTGVNVAYKFSGQVLNLQVVNSDSPQFASEKYKNKALAVSVLWEGNLLNDALKTRWAYGAFQHEKEKFYNWLSAGVQINAGIFSTDLDYYLGSRNMNYGSIVGDENLGTRYVQDQAASLEMRLKLGKWRPSVKGIWDQRYDKDSDRNAYENVGLQGALEYYPFSGAKVKDLRFHLVYNFVNTSFKGLYSQLSNSNTHTILLGTRWLFKAK